MKNAKNKRFFKGYNHARIAKGKSGIDYDLFGTIKADLLEETPISILKSFPDDLWDYGDLLVNGFNDKIFEIQNMGSIELKVTALSIPGTNSNQFKIISPTNLSFTIAVGATQEIIIRFNPTSAGIKNASLVIANNSENASPNKTINISGNGIVKSINFASITTTAVSAINLISASSGGKIVSDGNASITSRGVCWSTTANPTITNSKTYDGVGTGTFTSRITGLASGSTYHVRAYATNAAGTAYGADIQFVTNTKVVIPSISTHSIFDLKITEASSGGNIISDGGTTVTERGICWSKGANPTIANSKTSDGTGSGTFISNMVGLTSGTSYHVRAYATNSAGTAYGEDIFFITNTQIVIPTIITIDVFNLKNFEATSGGNIISDGGSNVTSKGVCWDISPNPTIGLSTKTIDGTGKNTFTSNITGLTAGRTYHVKAYATNSAGTAYGEDIAFTTAEGIIPVANFSATPINGCEPLTVNFIDQSYGDPTSWEWDIDNNGVVDYTVQNPTHIYSTEGTYSVKLSVSNASGLNSKTITNFIIANLTVTPIVTIDVSPSSTINLGNPVTFTANPIYGGSAPQYQWKLDGINIGNNNPTYTTTSLTNGQVVSCIMTSNSSCVSNAIASSNIITMKVNKNCFAPSNTYIPLIDKVTTPGSAVFEIFASGSDNLYQWQYNTGSSWLNVPNSVPYSGVGSTALTINATSISMNGYQYRCFVSSSCTTATAMSDAVVLTVTSGGCTVPSAPTSCSTSIGDPANGLEHWTKLSCDQVSNADGYSFEYSWDGITWGINWFQTKSQSVTVNHGDSPNGSIHYRVRAYKCSPQQYSSYTYASPQPIYTACDEASSPTINGNTSSSLNVTLYAETPVGNPSYTTYSIYCSTTKQYLQTNGTLGSNEVFQTKSKWGTKTITGLLNNEEYCFYAKARNNDGDVRFNDSNTACGTTVSSVAVVPQLTTTSITAISARTATSGGNIITDGGSMISAKGVCWSMSPNPTILNSKTYNGQGSDKFTSQINGLILGTTYYLRAYATNAKGTAYGEQLSFMTLNVDDGKTVSDSDGNEYTTVTIGTQVWMGQNLKTTNYNDGTPIPLVNDNTQWGALTTPAYCWYNNDIGFKNPYGALYNWYAVNTGKLCPVGWHVPTDDDWTTLINNIGGEEFAGGKLKESGTIHWEYPNTGATNEFNFAALPGGYRSVPFSNFGNIGYWWSSTEDISYSAWVRTMFFSSSDITKIRYSKYVGLSVRCLCDLPVNSEIILINKLIKVFPNPTSGIITIEGLPENEKTEIAIYNLNSKLVKVQTSNSAVTQMDISDLVSGVYLLVFNNRFDKKIKIVKYY